jgi:putative ABC transport system substrate-binding protein
MMGEPMRRRSFLTLLGTSAVAWPLAARAQQDGHVRRVGVLMGNDETDQESQARFQSFRQGLVELGWVEGRNVRIDVRWAGMDGPGRQSYARELVALAPEAILASTSVTAQALRSATRTIPIVFVNLNDPVATGVVSTLARPDANVTGFMSYEYSMAGKWLNLLKEIAPRLARVALIFNPDTAPFAPFYVRTAQDAGERLAVRITASGVRDAADIETVITALGGSDNGGLIVLPDGGFNILNRLTIISLAAKYRVPAIYPNRFVAADGGLMSYGTNPRKVYRDGASYVDRILRGAKPADLPVQFPTKFELVINMKTAKALGLTVPLTLQVAADEVIE